MSSLGVGRRASIAIESSSRLRYSMHVTGLSVFSGWNRRPSARPSSIIQSMAAVTWVKSEEGGKIPRKSSR